MYLITKRAFDLIFALIALLILSPILILVMIILRLTAEGEVFYFQERMGQNNKTFQVWKFATMLKNSEKLGTGTITLRNDFRVTPVGGFLRISKINELPQLVNILKGDMSLVGPRPLVPKDFEHYAPEIKRVIYKSKPGLSGIGSTIFRDEQEFVSQSELEPKEFYIRYIVPYKGAVEVWYYEHASALTDFLILFLTGWVIFFPKSELVYKTFPSLPPRPAELDPKTLRSKPI
ncbi:MAG: sugar transferase [Saprospiraceae bacterium]|nr:sugar transferase [Saprospiraceae bacterium]